MFWKGESKELEGKKHKGKNEKKENVEIVKEKMRRKKNQRKFTGKKRIGGKEQKLSKEETGKFEDFGEECLDINQLMAYEMHLGIKEKKLEFY